MMFKVCQRCFINGFFIDGQTQKKRSCFRAFKVCLGVLYLLILAGITTRCEELYSNNGGSIISTLDIFKQQYLMLQVYYCFLPLLTSYFHLKQPPYSVTLLLQYDHCWGFFFFFNWQCNQSRRIFSLYIIIYIVLQSF